MQVCYFLVLFQELKICWSEVREQQFVSSDLRFSNLVKTDCPITDLKKLGG
jgi:hypothetical protein